MQVVLGLDAADLDFVALLWLHQISQCKICEDRGIWNNSLRDCSVGRCLAWWVSWLKLRSWGGAAISTTNERGASSLVEQEIVKLRPAIRIDRMGSDIKSCPGTPQVDTTSEKVIEVHAYLRSFSVVHSAHRA